MSKYFILLIIILFLFAQHPTHINLALSGGGARGFAHLGVIKAFEEYGIIIDKIAGSSAGAYVGALYAAGYSVEEIELILGEFSNAEDIFKNYSRKDIPIEKKINTLNPFIELGVKNFSIEIPKSLSEDSRLNFFLMKYLSEPSLEAKNNFSNLKIPISIAVSDIFSEKDKKLTSGDLAQAVRASISIPTALPPVKIDGQLYVDGGLFNNLPTNYFKEEDFVVAVNTASEVIESPDELESIFDMSVHMINVLASKSDSSSVKNWDLFIEPNLNDIVSTDYQNYKEIIQIGYDETIKILQQKGYQKHEKRDRPIKDLPRLNFENYQIGKIKIKGDYRLTKTLITKNMDMETNDQFSWDKLNNGMNRLFAQKYINHFWVFFDIVDNKLDLTIEIEEQNLTRIGLGGYYMNSVGNNIFLDMSFIGRLGSAEVISLEGYLGNYKNGFRTSFRNNSIFKGPVYDYFHAAYFNISPEPYSNKDAEYDYYEVGYKTGLYFDAKTILLAELDYRLTNSENDDVGIIDSEYFIKFKNLSLTFSFNLENLDDKFFPTKGTSTSFSYKFNYANIERNFTNEELFSFNRFTLDFENHQSIFDKSFIFSQDYKFVTTINEGTNLIPFFEKTRLDITRSTYGYYDESLYGLHMARSTFTLKTKIINSFYFYSSYSLLTGWEKLEDISISKLSWDDIDDGYELGVYYPSVIGPILLTFSSDVYFKNALRFSIGYIF